MKTLVIAGGNLLKQFRRPRFIWMLAGIAILGALCVPPVDTNYSVIGIGGTRGSYNSAWLGAAAAIISCIATWVPGFFFLRNEISEDRKLRIGEMLASSPITKTGYIISKTLANLTVLWILQLLFLLSFIVLQLLRGENYEIRWSDYLMPFLKISLVNLVLLAAITVLFDALPLLRGILGNILFLFVWMFLTVGTESELLDIFGSQAIMNDMRQTAALTYPDILGRGMNFGYNPTDGVMPVFEWGGFNWSKLPVLPMLFCLGAGGMLTILSCLFFDRFKHPGRNMRLRLESMLNRPEAAGAVHTMTPTRQFSVVLSPTEFVRHRQIGFVAGELKVMLFHLPLWQYALLLGGGIVLPFLGRSFTPLIMLLPIAILSKLGCRNRIHRTLEIVHASCSPLGHLFTSYMAGVVLSLVLSAAKLVLLAAAGDVRGLLSWLIGIVFVCALALFCGVFTGSNKLFEAVYLMMYYAWLNQVEIFDFMGTAGDKYSLLYAVITGVLLVSCLFGYGRAGRRKGGR